MEADAKGGISGSVGETRYEEWEMVCDEDGFTVLGMTCGWEGDDEQEKKARQYQICKVGVRE